MFAYYIHIFLTGNAPNLTNEAMASLKKKWLSHMTSIITSAQKNNKFIDTMAPGQILNNLNYAIRGIVASVIFEEKGLSHLPPASTIYLPYLKGGK